MSEVDRLKAAVVSGLPKDPGSIVTRYALEALVRAVRDEEFLLYEKSRVCSWDGSDAPCEECPCDKTRYCP